MIDAARAFEANRQVMEDAAGDLANLVVNEIERLDALRIALAAFIDSAAGGDRSTATAEPEPSAGPSVAPAAPANEQPGPSRAGGSKRGPRGTRAASAGPESTAAPVSRPPAGQGDAQPAGGPPGQPSFELGPRPPLACPECEFTGRNVTGLGVHRRRKHGVLGATATTYERFKATGEIPPAPAADGKVQCPDCPARMVPAGIGPHRRARHGVTDGRHAAKPAEPLADRKPDHPSRGPWFCGRCPERFMTDADRQVHYDASGHGSSAPLPARDTPPLGAHRDPAR